jgi:hypothetical protein
MDDREKNYTRKMYEYVLQQQQQQQQYYNNYSYGNNQMVPPVQNVEKSTKINPGFYSQKYQPQPGQSQGLQSNIIPIPTQMMRPNHLDPTNGGNFLGFQMNPVSKNRKK